MITNGTTLQELNPEVQAKVAELVKNGLPRPFLSQDVLPLWGIFPRLFGSKPVLYGEKATLVRRIVKIVKWEICTYDYLALRALCHQAILSDLMHITEVQYAALVSGAIPDLAVSTTQYREADGRYHCWTCGEVSEAKQCSLSEHVMVMGGGTGRTQRVLVPYCPKCGEHEPEGRGHVLVPLAPWSNIPYCTDAILGVVIGSHVSLIYCFNNNLHARA